MSDLLARSEVYSEKVNEGVWMVVMDPTTGEPLGDKENRVVRIKLLGMDSKIVRRAIQDFENRIIQNVRKKGRRLDRENLRERTIDMLVAATVDWENMDWGGELDVPVTPKLAREIYAHEKLEWLRRDADAWIGDSTNYGEDAPEAVAGNDDEDVKASSDDPLAYMEEVKKNSSAGASGDSGTSGA